MKKAVLYIRVSTDEQAKGYSPRAQEEMLRLWCKHKGIQVVFQFTEDYSAKTFDRPEWKKMMAFFKIHTEVTHILVVKWDRFSRNVTDSLAMIRTLNKMGVEANAIDQWIDHDIPEQKLLLSIYLTSPEVENERRGLNTMAGMRRAVKEGRWVSPAPKGYSNVRINDEPRIVPNDEAAQIAEAFEMIATGGLSVEHVLLNLRRKGYKFSKTNFWRLLRNPVYAGHIILKKYREEPEQLIKGLHEPIIPMSLFKDVQDVLDGRKKSHPATNVANEITSSLPLRGHLDCSICGNVLTGSRSLNRHGNYYFYYHCARGCPERFRADKANQAFTNLLATYVVPEHFLRCYYIMMEEILDSGDLKQKAELRKAQDEITAIQNRLNTLDDKYFDGQIDEAKYKTLSIRYEADLEEQKTKLARLELEGNTYKGYMDYGFALLADLPNYYSSATFEVKKHILGSIFDKNLVFSGNAYRTPVVNPAIEIITLKANELLSQNNGKEAKFYGHVPYGTPNGTQIEPFWFGMERLAKLQRVLPVPRLAF